MVFQTVLSPGLDQPPHLHGPVHLAIGIFDGVHLGHQAVIDSAIHSAHSAGGEAGVLTFDPHPSTLLTPAAGVPLIMPIEMRRRMISRLGVDFIIEQPFNAAFSRIGAVDFVARLTTCIPALVAIYVGENWRFGRGRTGDVELLVQEAGRRGVAVFSARQFNHNGTPISSTRIRNLLIGGEIAAANLLLGQPYCSVGEVTAGNNLGRSIGFPTLNIPWRPALHPRYGVYAVRVRRDDIMDSPVLPAVANYGVRPTMGGSEAPVLECHVLGPCPFARGDLLCAEWLEFLRPEKKFESVELLQAQIARDRTRATDFFSKVS